MIRKFLVIFIFVFSSITYAGSLGKPITAHIQLFSPEAIAANHNQPYKTISLINWNLNQEQIQKIQNYEPEAFTPPQILPRKIYLGMNNVPVLDQGVHPTCVTFALSAVLDALEGKGDYVSELCSLELGNYLFPLSHNSNAWQGSTAPDVFYQMTEYGVLNKSYEASKICGGLSEYPANNEDETGTDISLNSFRPISDDVIDPFYPEYILLNEARHRDKKIPYNSNKVLYEIKKELAAGKEKPSPLGSSRLVVIGYMIPLVKNCGGVSTCGTFHLQEDTWTLSNIIKKTPNPMLGGHEAIVIGYDDDAVAKDADGLTHKGLLTLRSSWGPLVGDHGDFYMSYDYFTKYIGEATAVVRIPNY